MNTHGLPAGVSTLSQQTSLKAEHGWTGAHLHTNCSGRITFFFFFFTKQSTHYFPLCIPLRLLHGFYCFRSFATSPSWLGSLRFYVRARNTWRIENFFSHSLLRYCPKRLSFSFDGYTMRNQLAVIDHNEHLGREPAVTNDGFLRLTSKFSRRTREWVAYKVLRDKKYSYIPGRCKYSFRFIYPKNQNKYHLHV